MKGGSFIVFDESYNASPVSMRAALEILGQMQPEGDGRRIAVLGDMLELGSTAPDLHVALAPALVAAGIDQVFACGPHMAQLFDALPRAMRGDHQATSAQLLPKVVAAIRPGDTVLVKGSLGLAMAPIVQALCGLGEVVPDAASATNSSAANG